MDPVDVLIITALDDELEAVLELGEGGKSGWREPPGRSAFPTLRREFLNERGLPLRVAVGWAGQKGEVAAASRAEELTFALDPACLAMCGICAGSRDDVFLGDVIIADRVFSYDSGKHVAGADGDPATFLHDLETYNLETAWRMHAAQLARDLSGDPALAARRPASLAAQRRWILHGLYAAQRGKGPRPDRHPDRSARCPAWTPLATALLAEGLVAVTGGELNLTDGGATQVELDQALDPDGFGEDPPFRVHVGALATGKAVMQDPRLFQRLQQVSRSTLGVDMEAAAVGYVAQRTGRRSLIVKAVSDYADHDKDDSFRAFACRASASVLLAFLRRHLDPVDASVRPSGDEVKGHPRWLPPPEPPRYPNNRVRALHNDLESAWQRRRSLEQIGGRTDDVDRDIASLRRQLREGGLTAGATLQGDRYVLMERIGRGNFASVWKAFDHVEGTHVAIKVLRSDGDEPLRRERFFEGARRMSELRSCAVVPVLEPRGEDGRYDFFIMEFMDLGDLREAVPAGRIRAADMLSTVVHIGGALANAHAARLIHRDVKPANILLDRSGTPKLTDFDLVHVPDGTGRTQTGGLGSYLYAAPEQMKNARNVTARADVFGLGMTAVFLLHGDDPADLLDDQEAFFAALPCSDAVRAVLRRAVERRDKKRYGSVDEMCTALLAASETGVETAQQIERLRGWCEGPDAVPAAIRLADLLVAAGVPDGARRVLEHGLSCASGEVELRSRLLKLHRERGAWAEVADMLTHDARAATAHDEQRSLYLEAADVRATHLKQVDGAVDLLLEAAKASPTTCVVFPILEEAAGALERSADTLALLRQIVGLERGVSPLDLTSIRLSLATAYAERGDSRTAATHLDAALAADPDSRELARASSPALAALLAREAGPDAAQQAPAHTVRAYRRDRVSSLIDYSAKEIHVNIVYAGAANSGVSTNLDYIYKRTPPDSLGRSDRYKVTRDRGQLFDFKPASLGTIRGFGTRFHLCSMPHEPYYENTRKSYLKGVSGIVFVADSRVERIDANLEQLEQLRELLVEMGSSLDGVPLVFQYNKRDRPEAITVEELHAMLNPTDEPEFEAVAHKGIGVFDTLKSIAKLILIELRRGLT